MSNPVHSPVFVPYFVDNGDVVHFGGCWDGDHDVQKVTIDCQLDKSGCPATASQRSSSSSSGSIQSYYYSSYLLKATQVGGSNNHQQCRAADIRGVARSCPAVAGLCAKDCDEDDVMEGNVQGESTENNKCTLIQDTWSNTLTVFGACQDMATNALSGCFWSVDDCMPGSERFLAPAQVVDMQKQPGGDQGGPTVSAMMSVCDCSQVRTGACDAGAAYGMFCAVSADSCSSGETFVAARDLPSYMDCRLCDASFVTDQLVRNTLAALDIEVPDDSTSTPSASPVEDVDIMAPIPGVEDLIIPATPVSSADDSVVNIGDEHNIFRDGHVGNNNNNGNGEGKERVKSNNNNSSSHYRDIAIGVSVSVAVAILVSGMFFMWTRRRSSNNSSSGSSSIKANTRVIESSAGQKKKDTVADNDDDIGSDIEQYFPARGKEIS